MFPESLVKLSYRLEPAVFPESLVKLPKRLEPAVFLAARYLFMPHLLTFPDELSELVGLPAFLR